MTVRSIFELLLIVTIKLISNICIMWYKKFSFKLIEQSQQ